MQQSAISSIMLSKLDHKAAVHCGAVTFVGSVRNRDLYIVVFCDAADGSAIEMSPM